MEKPSTELKVEIEGIKELQNKLNKAMGLIEEANAILNDVAQNSTLDISLTSSARK